MSKECFFMDKKDWTGNTQSVMATLNASCHTENKRAKQDYYATPPKAVTELLNRENFSDVWEPACGEGHISEVLVNHNIHFLSSDVVNRGYGLVEDFLNTNRTHSGDIITNPPFSKSTEFTFRAMRLLEKGRKLAMLLRIQFLESKKRKVLFAEFPPKYVYVNSSRQLCAMDGKFEEYKATALCYC